MIHYVRSTRKCPNWIDENLWIRMCAYWDTDDAKRKSEIASKNSTSDPDGLGVGKHVSGPKSHEAIRRKMAREEGREVSVGEVFIKTRKRKNGNYVDEKSRRIGEAFEEKLQSSQSQISMTSDGASNAVELTAEEKDALFMESTTKDGRGNPYGLGRMAKKLKKSKQVTDLASSSQVTCLEEKLRETEAKMEQLKEDNKQRLDFVMEELRELRSRLPLSQPVHHTSPAVNQQGANSGTDSDAAEDDDEDEDEEQST